MIDRACAVTPEELLRLHGRVEVRTLKVAAVAGLCFPHAAQAIQVIRRVRAPATSRWRTVTADAVTSLALAAPAPPS